MTRLGTVRTGEVQVHCFPGFCTPPLQAAQLPVFASRKVDEICVRSRSKMRNMETATHGLTKSCEKAVETTGAPRLHPLFSTHGCWRQGDRQDAFLLTSHAEKSQQGPKMINRRRASVQASKSQTGLYVDTCTESPSDQLSDVALFKLRWFGRACQRALVQLCFSSAASISAALLGISEALVHSNAGYVLLAGAISL